LKKNSLLFKKPNSEIDLLAKTFAYQIWCNSFRNIRGRENQNSEQIYPSELNTKKPLPVVPAILVYEYMQLIGKANKKGDTFYPCHLSSPKLLLDTNPVLKAL